jgi:hypothetical protein
MRFVERSPTGNHRHQLHDGGEQQIALDLPVRVLGKEAVKEFFPRGMLDRNASHDGKRRSLAELGENLVHTHEDASVDKGLPMRLTDIHRASEQP